MPDDRDRPNPVNADPNREIDPSDPLDPTDPAEETSLRRGPHEGIQGGAPLSPEEVEEAESDEAADALRERVEPRLETPELAPATLGGIDGHGVLMIVRDREGAFVEADGTWRPDDPTVTTSQLREQLPEGETATFAGRQLSGRADEAPEEVERAVVVTSHGEYRRDDGSWLRVVNFEPAERS
jgi:hypothetical protein